MILPILKHNVAQLQCVMSTWSFQFWHMKITLVLLILTHNEHLVLLIPIPIRCFFFFFEIGTLSNVANFDLRTFLMKWNKSYFSSFHPCYQRFFGNKNKRLANLTKEILGFKKKKLPYFEEKKVRSRQILTLCYYRSLELGTIPKNIYLFTRIVTIYY